MQKNNHLIEIMKKYTEGTDPNLIMDDFDRYIHLGRMISAYQTEASAKRMYADDIKGIKELLEADTEMTGQYPNIRLALARINIYLDIAKERLDKLDEAIQYAESWRKDYRKKRLTITDNED